MKTLINSFGKSVAALLVLLIAAGLYFATRPPRPVLPLDCVANREYKVDLVTVASMGIKTTLYGIDLSGRLFKLDLNNGRRADLGTHHFEYRQHEFSFGPAIARSADGHWISYSHELGNRAIGQYWLFDTRLETERLAFETRLPESEYPQLSPDGKLLAVATQYGTKAAGAKGLFLIDTATLQRSRIELPANIASIAWLVSPHWSSDGKELLIKFQSYDGEPLREEYYSWHLGSKEMEAISGRGDDAYGNLHFLRQGAEVPMARVFGAQSEQPQEELASPSGAWLAQLRTPDAKGKFSLEIQNRNGTITSAFSAPYTPCGSAPTTPLAITGWVEDRFLIYNDAVYHYFIFDAESGNTAYLFDGIQDSRIFLW